MVSTGVEENAATVESRISAAARTGSLDLSDCGLEEMPPVVLKLDHLVDLSLAGNRISKLPEDMGNLRNLRRLGLAGNSLECIPPSIGQLQNLEGLWLHGNLLTTLPSEIGELSRLRMLAAAGNRLPLIPDSLGSLRSLQSLSLAGNDLVSLPESIGSLSSLKVLAVNGNRLADLPPSLGGLLSLQQLWLQGNCLRKVPRELESAFRALTQLRQLSIAESQLEGIPGLGTLGELPSLDTLWLYGNRLSEIPAQLAQSRSLRYLWAEGNALDATKLASLLPSLRHLKAVGVDANTARLLPREIVTGVNSNVRVSEILGRSSGPGYFKLQTDSSTSRKSGDLNQESSQEAGPLASDGPLPAEAARSDVVVVAFGSAPGVPNWAGLLRRVRQAMRSAAPPVAPAFDVLFVVDPSRSWFAPDGEPNLNAHVAASRAPPAGSVPGRPCQVDGRGGYYPTRLAEAVGAYRRVVLLGDSMGASAALMFAHLATCVLAFCPQVDLSGASIRPGREEGWLRSYNSELLAGVEASPARITVHCGNWSHDVDQAGLLPSDKVELVVHGVNDHRLAKSLDEDGKLVSIVQTAIEEELKACKDLEFVE